MTNQVNQDVIKPIEYDHEMDRFYIPVNSRYEIQTKGKGSSFRIANTSTHLRSIVLNDSLHPVLEDMAKATNAEMMQLQAATQVRESEINSLKQRVEELESWKNQAIAVESEWNCQSVGKALNIPLGNSIRANILPKIAELTAYNNKLRRALEKTFSRPKLQNEIDNILSSTPAQSLVERDNTIIERIATALENAEGELKYLPEYVALVRALKSI